MLDRSQARQGRHPAIDRLRAQARERCGTRGEAADRVARSVIARDEPWSNSPYAFRPLLGQNNATTSYEHDFDAPRTASTWIVIGAGAESEGETPTVRRSPSPSGAEASPPSPRATTAAPSAEFGGRVAPDAFAATLRDVLDGR